MIDLVTYKTRVALVIAILLSGLLPTSSTFAQRPDGWDLFDKTPRRVSRDSTAMRSLLRPLAEAMHPSVVQIFSGSRLVSLGTIVSEDGFVLTKRSELSGDPVTVRLPNGEKASARVAVVRRENDLALLAIKSNDEDPTFKPAKFQVEEPRVGTFLVSPGRDGQVVGLGVLGVQARPIAHKGRLGIELPRTEDGPALVRSVKPASGADAAGVKNGDTIMAINGQALANARAAFDTLGSMYPGEVVHLTILRDGNTLELDAQMTDQKVMMESKNDTRVNGPRNVRLSGFESVIQHDTVLPPNQCGGPLLDSKGNVVGINIARAGRVVSYALPSALVVGEMIGMLEEARQ